MISEKTIGCFFETIGCFYQQFLKTEFKELRVRDKHASNLYWFTLTPRATSSPQKPLGIPLCNQNQITNTTHQSSDLKPLKKHTTFGKTTPRMLILNPSRTHNTPWQHNYKNTVIKEEGNRIHLGITKLKDQNYNPIIFHTLKNDPKLFQILEKLF